MTVCAHGEDGGEQVAAAAGRRSGFSQEPSREARRGLQVLVGCLLAVAVVATAYAANGRARTHKRAEGLASKLYAWTNGNSVISGVDADDPAFAPDRARVPPVDRVIAQLKGLHNPEFYDQEHHGPNAQFVNPGYPFARDRPHSAVSPGDYATDSGTTFVMDPAATDDSQFNINLLVSYLLSAIIN